MELRPPRFSRRAFIPLVAVAPLAGQGRPGAMFPAVWRRYPDPITELTVVRLTDPALASHLPPSSQRAVSRRGDFLLFASECAGKPQAFRMELRSGESRQLTEVQALDPASLTLDSNERGFFCFDGPTLKRVDFRNLREREIYRVLEGWERCPGFSLAADGRSAVIGERRQGASRLVLLETGRSRFRTILEGAGEIAEPLICPGSRPQVLYRKGAEVWLASIDGRGNRKLDLAEGVTGPAFWHPGGDTVLYLNFPADKTRLHAIHEYSPDDGRDKLLARTSQFVNFTFNRDTSVFLGASRNAASPTVLLLLRVTRREFTICEHRASDPAKVNLAFSPDSQTVFFESDRHGKSAIYTMRVEKLVEQT